MAQIWTPIFQYNWIESCHWIQFHKYGSCSRWMSVTCSCQRWHKPVGKWKIVICGYGTATFDLPDSGNAGSRSHVAVSLGTRDYTILWDWQNVIETLQLEDYGVGVATWVRMPVARQQVFDDVPGTESKNPWHQNKVHDKFSVLPQLKTTETPPRL